MWATWVASEKGCGAGGPSGHVRTRLGPVLWVSAELAVTVLGTGGHASAPHLVHGPVPAAAEMILALHRAVGRCCATTSGAAPTTHPDWLTQSG